MLSLLRRLGARFGAAPLAIDDTLWQATIDACPLLSPLSPTDQRTLRDLTGRFLAHKRFAPVQGMQLDDSRCLVIAAMACLPVLHLGFDWLRGWREVIVYPGEFRVRREHHDDHTGVVTEGDDVLIGEAWERGPLILSWADIVQDLEDPHAGFNVILHEITHKLDMLDGATDGVPPMPPWVSRREWIETFQRAYEAHCAAVDQDEETVIDPYAAEGPDEFLACLAEAWFSAPDIVDREMPGVGQLLARFFGPPPS
ncbi:zinc-dependent peptidase [Tahibacter amnicola]|uniref:Zinc-dependent peptidase n=1 Tax=Tahibacter amnicola TaxID=2976241 RepID=A0ABY6BD25_9GAMM|nr:M90 family metallopeptidase [Tahibacter amnicola]UXI67941.1 zinc-dependent peptidase [Tahibacter amnicola]